tara:strand:- start:304 stop:1449 length:1146 start_codon:yes stop_codon:yes gene_type:complete
MFRPQIQKTSTLFFIAIFNLFMVYLSVNSTVQIKRLGFNDKISAANHMQKCIDNLNSKNSYISNSDIYKTGLLGIQSSSITTIQDLDSSMLKSKLLTTHPNFAAFIVELLHEAELTKGDTVAVSMTGSFPGANLAFYSACQIMNIKPVVISSVGSSSWGANREDFSWPHIENYLYRSNLISNHSVAYSMGGDNDNADNLSDKGVEIIESVIPDYAMLVNNSSLSENIDHKLSIFNSFASEYSMYVNIGGGVSSLGPGKDKDTLKVGVINLLDINDMEFSEFKKSIAYQFLYHESSEDYQNSIPMLNIKKIIDLVPNGYKKEFFNGNMKIGKGNLFYKYNPYNPTVILIGLIMSLGLIITIGIYSHLQIKRRMETHEVDSII